MKKFISVIAIMLMLALTACSNKETPPTTDNSSNTQSDSVTMLEEGVWPENEYTEGLPIPLGTVSWAMLDTEHGYCSINIVDISETEYNEYMEFLKQEGFSVIEEVSEEIKGQDYVSIGTLLSKLVRLSLVDLPSANGFDKPFAASKFEKPNTENQTVDWSQCAKS